MKYYKIVYDYSIIMFCFDEESDSLKGMFEEIRTESKVTFQKHKDSLCYSRVSSNTTAQAMIKKAEEITKDEYETGKLVINSMINSDEWFISDRKVAKQEVVLKPIYAD